MNKKFDWGQRAQKGFLASGLDPADRKGHKNYYIDLLQKMALENVLELRGDETVLDFGCGSGRISYWIAEKVKRVVGLEVSSKMIELAERNRTTDKVEFLLYDGIHFPVFSEPFDLILSVGVLQQWRGDELKEKVSQLSSCIKKEGKVYLIEQVSDNPKVGRPRMEEYLGAFRQSKFESVKHFPIRNGRRWILYLIQYGMIPKALFYFIAKNEIRLMKKNRRPILYYQDHLFIFKSPLIN
ncbi:MAG: class I SAM-dependent methyltransferase [Thermodesulfobacteriota bacterium]